MSITQKGAPYQKNGKTYVKTEVEARVLAGGGALWSGAQGVATDTDGNVSFPYKTSLNRDLYRFPPKPWYYHQSLKVRVGTSLYFHGRTKFAPVPINANYNWTGDFFPVRVAYDWLKCTVVA